MYRSKCCKAHVFPIVADEGTGFYMCAECQKPADIESYKMSKAKFKKLVKRIKESY